MYTFLWDSNTKQCSINAYQIYFQIGKYDAILIFLKSSLDENEILYIYSRPTLLDYGNKSDLNCKMK